jgi:hypothetical protein
MDDPIPPPAAPAAKYAASDYLFQFITITAGVLIALLINGLVEWNSNRNLVREARTTIARELAANHDEVNDVLAGNSLRLKNLDEALALVSLVLAGEKPASASMNLGYNLADLSNAAWDSAMRTGALSHMDYADVQAYSLLYAHQDLFAQQQAKAMDHLTAALVIFSDQVDPLSAKPPDLERFRERVLALKAGLTVEQQLAERLVNEYAEQLAR